MSQREHDSNWITLTEAAEQFQLDRSLLVRLVKEGCIPVWMNGSPEPRVDRKQVRELARELDRRQWQALEGSPISLSEAERVYRFRTSTLSSWARKGYLRTIERSKREVYLDESDVAYARALVDLFGLKSGKALFPSSPQYAAL